MRRNVTNEGWVRFEVRQMADGKYGVYDRQRGSFPVEGGPLSGTGLGRLDWMVGRGARQKAERACATLNEFHGYQVEADDVASGDSGNDIEVLAERLRGAND